MEVWRGKQRGRPAARDADDAADTRRRRQIFQSCQHFPTRTHAATYAVQTAATNVRNLPSPSICPGPNQLETIRYEMPISKADISQLNLTHGTKKTEKWEKRRKKYKRIIMLRSIDKQSTD